MVGVVKCMGVSWFSKTEGVYQILTRSLYSVSHQVDIKQLLLLWIGRIVSMGRYFLLISFFPSQVHPNEQE